MPYYLHSDKTYIYARYHYEHNCISIVFTRVKFNHNTAKIPWWDAVTSFEWKVGNTVIQTLSPSFSVIFTCSGFHSYPVRGAVIHPKNMNFCTNLRYRVTFKRRNAVDLHTSFIKHHVYRQAHSHSVFSSYN